MEASEELRLDILTILTMLGLLLIQGLTRLAVLLCLIFYGLNDVNQAASANDVEDPSDHLYQANDLIREMGTSVKNDVREIGDNIKTKLQEIAEKARRRDERIETEFATPAALRTPAPEKADGDKEEMNDRDDGNDDLYNIDWGC